MGEDLKKQDGGPEEAKRMQSAIPDDTEGHRKRVVLATEPDGGPEEAKRMQSAIPDSDDDTEGHKK